MPMSISNENHVRAATPDPGATRSSRNVDGVPGLRLIVSRTGTKTWRLESRRAGKHTIGHWPEVSLAEAKRAATTLIGSAERRAVNDATGEKVLAVKDTRTLTGILDIYQRERGAAVRSWPAMRRAIEYRYGGLLDKPAAGLTRAVLTAPVIKERNVAAKRACRYLSTVLSHCEIGEPVANRKLDDLVPEHAVDRVLTDDELRAVWNAAAGIEPPWTRFFRLLVLTAVRRGDAALAHADHVDLENRVWHARIHKVKGKAFVIQDIPLTGTMVELIRRQVEAGGWLFPTKTGAPISANFDRVLKRLHERSKTANWTWHDLRRSARTIMGREGVAPHIAERCLGHKVAGAVERTYDRHTYENEIRIAFESLEAAVMRNVMSS